MSVVLTPEAAQRYFGDADPMGQTLTYNTNHTFTVTGVTAEVPTQMHLQPDFIASIPSLPMVSFDGILTQWAVFHTYAVVTPGTNTAVLAEKITAFRHEAAEEAGRTAGPAITLQPVTDVHLRSQGIAAFEAQGDIRYVYLLLTLAALILGIACINYTNLATARAMTRAREVGVRKVVGARRAQIVQQFLGESFLVTLLAVVLALGLLAVMLPRLSMLLGTPLRLADAMDALAIGVPVLVIVIGLAAGAYPAFMLARFESAHILKGGMRAGRHGRWLRQSLVVVQFAASAVLLIGTLAIGQQLSFIQATHLGFDQAHVVTVPLQDAALRTNYATLAATWLRDPAIEAVGASSSSYPGRAHSGQHRLARTDDAATTETPDATTGADDTTDPPDTTDDSGAAGEGRCAADMAILSCDAAECAFEVAEVDCAAACANIATLCANNSCDAQCTGLESDPALCSAACEGTKGLMCSNVVFGCYTSNSGCDDVGNCVEANL